MLAHRFFFFFFFFVYSHLETSATVAKKDSILPTYLPTLNPSTHGQEPERKKRNCDDPSPKEHKLRIKTAVKHAEWSSDDESRRIVIILFF